MKHTPLPMEHQFCVLFKDRQPTNLSVDGNFYYFFRELTSEGLVNPAQLLKRKKQQHICGL